MSFVGVCSSAQNTWSIAHAADRLSGINSNSCPPFSSKGTLDAAVSGNSIEVATLTYQDGSSHSTVQKLALSGRASSDDLGFHGTLSGDYSATPVFGGIAGPTSSCHDDAMSFRFTRLP